MNAKIKTLIYTMLSAIIMTVMIPFASPDAKAISDTWCTHDGTSRYDTVICNGKATKTHKYRVRILCSPIIEFYGSTYVYSPWAVNGNPTTASCGIMWTITAKRIQWTNK